MLVLILGCSFNNSNVISIPYIREGEIFKLGTPTLQISP